METFALFTAAILSLSGVHATPDRADHLGRQLHDVLYIEEELPFGDDPHALEKTGLVMVAIAYHESGFREGVEQCRRSDDGLAPFGDHGLSVGLTQVMKGPNWEGLDRDAEICGDAAVQFRLGLHVLVRARKNCRGGVGGWLGGYNAGACITTKTSAATLETYRGLLRRFEREWADAA